MMFYLRYFIILELVDLFHRLWLHLVKFIVMFTGLWLLMAYIGLPDDGGWKDIIFDPQHWKLHITLSLVGFAIFIVFGVRLKSKILFLNRYLATENKSHINLSYRLDAQDVFSDWSKAFH